MAGTDVEIEVANIKLETRRLLQSSVAILEKVQALTRIQPTSWDQLKMMLETTAEYDDWDEKIQNWLMNVKSSLAALGINTNFQYKVSTESVTVKTSLVLHNPDLNPQVCVRTL